MSNLTCRKTMMSCPTPGMCAPYGGCTSQPAIESALKADYDTLRTANQRLEGDVARLREVAREFAGYWSSDNPKHWELHGLADGADYSDALRGNGGDL
jgi:hypothetical protein